MRRFLRYLLLLFVLLVMATIFYLSSQSGVDSSAMSGRVTRIVLSLFVRGFKTMSEMEQAELILQSQHLIRKLAHFSEYAALGFFSCGFLHTYGNSISFKKGIGALLFCFFYASSDEFHQSFVESRGAGVKDVLIDSSGALFGILIVILFTFLIYQYGKKKGESRN